MADTEAELHKYLADHQVETLLKDIVVKLCINKPADPLTFVKDYISELQTARGAEGGATEAEEPARVTRRASRRGAVSASVMGTDEAMGYQKKVIPKDAATMLKLEEAIKHNVLFQHLEKDELIDVMDAMVDIKKKAGEVVMSQGDEGDYFYVIHSGTVEVWIANGDQPAEHHSDIAENGFFGELALIYGTPRAATIKTKTDCEFFAIDRDTYRRILMQSTIKKRDKYQSFLEQVGILKSLDKWERLAVADALEPVEFPAGTVVVKQGDLGSEFFIVVQGEAVVTRTNDQGETGEVGRLGAAEYFGEIALLTHEPRKATVTAQSPLKCVKLDRERFERVLGPCEDILRRNMDNYKQFQPDAK